MTNTASKKVYLIKVNENIVGLKDFLLMRDNAGLLITQKDSLGRESRVLAKQEGFDNQLGYIYAQYKLKQFLETGDVTFGKISIKLIDLTSGNEIYYFDADNEETLIQTYQNYFNNFKLLIANTNFSNKIKSIKDSFQPAEVKSGAR